MKHAFLIAAAAVLLCGCSAPRNSILNELDAYKAEFTEWPTHVPTDKTADAPLAGNGDIGLTMKTSEEGITFFIGKNDFWRALQSYPEGGLALPGALVLSSDIISSGVYHAEQLPGSAEIRATYTLLENELSVTAWVAATDNKVVVELSSKKEMSLNLAFLPAEDGPLASVIRQGTDEGCSWMTRSFCDEPRLQWDSHIALALNHTTGSLTLTPGKKQTLVLAVYTNIDTPDWEQKAISEAQGCAGKDMEALKDEHRSWWSDFWNLSHVDIGDEWMERYYYQSQYLLACCSRAGKTAPGLWGSFICSEETAWAGDYHLNYNYQSPYWGCFSSNHISLTENYDQPLLDYMEKGRNYARELLGCRGLYYPVGIGPFALSSAAWPDTDEKMDDMYGYTDHMLDGGNMFWGQKSNASFGAVNMMMRFYATWDEEYARKIYPYILGCAEFWEDFLVLRDGKYESVNDCFYEEWPGRGSDNDVNPTCSLGLIRMVMRGALDISSLLDVDGDRRSGWQDILDNLSDFPVGYTEDGRLSLKGADRKGVDSRSEDFKPAGLNRIHMHGVLIPPMVSGPLTDARFSGIMLDDMNHWTTREGSDWGGSMSNGVETVYAGAARLGFSPEKILQCLRERIEMGSYPNCYIVAEGGGIETLAAVPFTINEMLMQSFEGTLRLFPCWVRSQDASFRHLRANGAFLVSASIKDGMIGDVELLSEQGRPCRMENPWPGQAVIVRHSDGGTETLRGDFVEFPTQKNETLRIEPQAVRPASPAGTRGKAPVIGISAHPSGSRNVANTSYVQAVRNAGGIALILPYTSDAAVIDAMLDKVDGVIMTGGEDFAPALYGEEAVPELETVVGLRDTCDISLVHAAVAKGLPVLGICRGEQLLGVAFGGTLYQDIPSMIETDVTHRGIPLKEFSHTIAIEDGSFLSEIWGRNSFDVNSAHHQGIKAVPQGFSVVATTEDGVVEAVQRTGALSDEYQDGKGMIIGVQFHPEAMASKDAAGPFTDLFRYFVAAAKAGRPYYHPVRW